MFSRLSYEVRKTQPKSRVVWVWVATLKARSKTSVSEKALDCWVATTLSCGQESRAREASVRTILGSVRKDGTRASRKIGRLKPCLWHTFYKIKIFIYIIYAGIWRSERMTCKNWVSFTTWILGLQLMSSGLVGSALPAEPDLTAICDRWDGGLLVNQ